MTTYFFSTMFRLSFVLLFLLAALPVSGAEISNSDNRNSVLKGKISDMEGRAVEGAMVFVYDSPDVKRAANFISSRTDKEGTYRIVVPAGRYWLVARTKSSEDYGPLMLKDRHSGDPVETDLAPEREAETDFVVADLMEAIKMKRQERERPLKISGRITDEKGSPVSGAYAIANRKQEIARVPDYLSTWVDSEGRYTMYVPRGRYYIGSASSFPPGQDYSMNEETGIDSDTTMDIIRKTPGKAE